MRFVVDALFCDGKPRLRVVDADSGKVQVQWSLDKVRNLFQEKEIIQQNLRQPERYGMQSLLKNLFLIACREDLAHNSSQVNAINIYDNEPSQPESHQRKLSQYRSKQ